MNMKNIKIGDVEIEQTELGLDFYVKNRYVKVCWINGDGTESLGKFLDEIKNEKFKRNNELVLAGLFDKDADYGGMTGKAVQELLDVFAKQGHSGFSAQLTANIFRKIIKGETLTPLTGEDSEWTNKIDKNVYQNNRCSALFKDGGVDSRAYYLDAIVWRGENGHTFTGTVEGIRSRQYVKFPFTQKTFYVDVIRDEDKSIYKIKDRLRLKEVFKYYDKYK